MAGIDRLRLLPAFSRISAEKVLEASLSGEVVACDFYVEGAERGREEPGGYRIGRLLNVDHHAPTPRMSRMVSSTNLAIAQAEAAPIDPGAQVVINHTDCDSILSSAIVAGLLPADPRYGSAAIAADHTGDEDPIADLLQAIDPFRDPAFSLRSLRALERGAPLDPSALERMDDRRRRRERAERYVAEGRFRSTGCVRWGTLDDVIDSTFFAALLPDACVILAAMPLRGQPDRWEVKVRLGLAAPAEMTLHDLRIGEWDPAFGGRWNAGANRRAGGTTIPIEAYAAELWRRIGLRHPAAGGGAGNAG
jgi:hypothetical protein